MEIDNRALVLDMVAWIAARPRDYAVVMEAWRTSCPRLTVWEDAVDAGLVVQRAGRVEATSAGHAFLAAGGRSVPA